MPSLRRYSLLTKDLHQVSTTFDQVISQGNDTRELRPRECKFLLADQMRELGRNQQA